MKNKLKKKLKKMEKLVNRLESLDWECREAERLRMKLIKQEEEVLKHVGCM